MTTIGFVGSGRIGSSVARAAIDHGYDVVMSNSREPETLTDLIADLGPHAKAATTVEAAGADFIVVSIPLAAERDLPAAPFVGKIVIDADNYYFERDGHVPEIDDFSTTVAGHLQQHLVGAKVVKAFNHINSALILDDAKPAGTPGRRALAIASDFPEASELATRFLDEIGFDSVDMGPLSESWRTDRDMPAYGAYLDKDALTAKLAEGRRA